MSEYRYEILLPKVLTSALVCYGYGARPFVGADVLGDRVLQLSSSKKKKAHKEVVIHLVAGAVVSGLVCWLESLSCAWAR